MLAAILTAAALSLGQVGPPWPPTSPPPTKILAPAGTVFQITLQNGRFVGQYTYTTGAPFYILIVPVTAPPAGAAPGSSAPLVLERIFRMPNKR